MKTNQSIKANLAIIMLVIVSAFWQPTIARAQTLKSLKLSFMSGNTLMNNYTDNQTEETPLNLEKLEIIQFLGG